MICSSVNLNRFIVRPSQVTDSTHFSRKFRGSGQEIKATQKISNISGVPTLARSLVSFSRISRESLIQPD